MMHCKKMEKLTMQFMDGDAEIRNLPFFQTHLESCEKCRETFLCYEMIAKELSTPEPIEAPTDFEAVVMAQVRVLDNHKAVIDYQVVDQRIGRIAGIVSLVFSGGVIFVMYSEPIVRCLTENSYLEPFTEQYSGFFDSLIQLSISSQEFISAGFASVSQYLQSTQIFLFAILGIIVSLQYYAVHRERALK